MERKTFTLAMAGAGLAATLFIGCELGQDSSGNPQDTQSALLRLAVKDSGDCRALHARCALAHRDGRDSAVLTDSLVGRCIIDTAKAREILEHRGDHGRPRGWQGGFDGDRDDRGPRLDSAARAALCDSLTKAVAGMDSTDSGYIEARRHAAHACFVPPAPLDSAARAALCDSLKTSLAAADSTSREYMILAHVTREVCEERRGPDDDDDDGDFGIHR